MKYVVRDTSVTLTIDMSCFKIENMKIWLKITHRCKIEKNYQKWRRISKTFKIKSNSLRNSIKSAANPKISTLVDQMLKNSANPSPPTLAKKIDLCHNGWTIMEPLTIIKTYGLHTVKLNKNNNRIPTKTIEYIRRKSVTAFFLHIN